MIDHIGISVSDFAISKIFYTAALKPLGFELVMEVSAALTERGDVAGFGAPPKPELWIAHGIPNNPPIHIAMRVASRQVVDEFYRTALAAGGRDNGAPGIRAYYHPHYYGAFVFDPDGHNIEAVCHEPE